MALTLAVANQKGGVGKTTTAVNVATGLALAGKRILAIDADPQGNLTGGLGIADKRSLPATLYDSLVRGCPLQDAIWRDVAVPGLHLVPANLDLASADLELAQSLSRETLLRRALKPILNDYDFIIMDAPPSLGLISINLLAAADMLLVPVQCEYYALEGIGQLMMVVQHVQTHLNRSLEIGMVILTMYDERVNLARQVVAEVQQHFGDRVARTLIPRNVRLSEAPSFGRPIQLYDPKSKGALAYEALTQEILELERKTRSR